MRLVARLGLEQRVILRDPVFGADKWTVLANAHALVYPSRWDGLPFSVLEALAAQVPVLVTRGTNLDELVQRYRAGVVVQGRVDAIARGLGQLLALPLEEQLEMGRRARQLVAEHFTWPLVVARMADAYRAVV
jgi:glycosyltransferase involved in cell wall biosynthesis